MNPHSAQRKTALFFIMLSLLMAGCGTTKVNDTKTYVKPTQPITNMRVIYIAHILKSDKSTYDPAASTGYRNLPQLLQQRVPLVFGLNNITVDYLALETANPSGMAENGNVAFNNGSVSKLLVLQIQNGMQYQNRSGQQTVLTWEASLSDTKTKAKLWTGHFKSELDVALFAKQYYNNEYVDKFLKAVLEQMAKDGLIVLADNTAIIPEPGNKDAATKLPLPTQIATSHKVPAFKDFISKLDIIADNNAAPKAVVELNNRLTSAIVKALKNTCIKEVNGFSGLDKVGLDKVKSDAAKTNTALPDMNFVLVMKPVRRIKIEGLQSDTIRFGATLHQVTNDKPTAVDMVWDAEIPVTRSAFQQKPDNINQSATEFINLMIKDGLIRETCN